MIKTGLNQPDSADDSQINEGQIGFLTSLQQQQVSQRNAKTLWII